MGSSPVVHTELEAERLNILSLLAFVSLITLGFAVRVYGLGHRSLWLDEAWVANLINSESFLSAILHQKETYWGPVPLLFAVSTKAAVSLFGNNEAAFRLVPCMFGIGSLLVFVLISRDLFPNSRLWLVPLGLFALHPAAIYYSKELKQYSGELFFAIAVIYLFLKARNDMSSRNISLLGLLVAGLLAIGFGIPLICLFVNVLFVLGYRFYSQNHKGLVSFAFITLLFLLLTEALMYLLWFAPQIGPTYSSLWEGDFFPPQQVTAIPRWLADRVLSFFNYDFAFHGFLAKEANSVIVLGFLFCLGVINLLKKKDLDLLAVYGLTMGGLTILSFAHKWPLGGNRVNLFLLPFHLIFVAYGIQMIVKLLAARIPKLSIRWSMGVASVFCFIPFQTLDENLWSLKEREEMRPIVDHIKNRFNPASERIYVYCGAKEAFHYYWSLDSRHQDPNLYYFGRMSRENPGAYLVEIDGYVDSLPKSVSGVYIVFSHAYKSEKEMLLEFSRKKFGNEIERKEKPGASYYLFSIPS